MTYDYKHLHHFIQLLFEKLSFNKNDAQLIADVLIAAELRGVPSHGLLRLPEYLQLIDKEKIKSNPSVTMQHETPSTALVDGDKALGMISGKYAMQLAIEKAKNVGTGWVAVMNSNHFGIAGFFSMMALEHDMIGIAMTNANPLVAPTNSKDAMLGTNPIAIAIPALHEQPFIADFATAPIARGKLDILHLKNKQAPNGIVQDKDGIASTNANILSEGGAILPLGGDEEHGGHKGYCLSAIVDILSAVLPGANFGPFIVPTLSYRDSSKSQEVGKGIGHFFGAMRVDAFRPAEDFKHSMDIWINAFKHATPVEGQERVFIPGEKERELEIKHKAEGIQLMDTVITKMTAIGTKYNIPF